MMPIRDVVIFPYMMTPFVVGRESSVRALEEALAGDKKIFLATQHDASIDEPKPERDLLRSAPSPTSSRASSCPTATSRFWWKAWSAPRSFRSPTTRASSAPPCAPSPTRWKPGPQLDALISRVTGAVRAVRQAQPEPELRDHDRRHPRGRSRQAGRHGGRQPAAHHRREAGTARNLRSRSTG